MRRKAALITLVIPLVLALALAGYTATFDSVEQVPRLTMDQVKEMLGKPDVVILDVRYIKQFEQSDKKLPGATWVDPEKIADYAANIPKDKTIITY